MATATATIPAMVTAIAKALAAAAYLPAGALPEEHGAPVGAMTQTAAAQVLAERIPARGDLPAVVTHRVGKQEQAAARPLAAMVAG